MAPSRAPSLGATFLWAAADASVHSRITRGGFAFGVSEALCCPVVLNLVSAINPPLALPPLWGWKVAELSIPREIVLVFLWMPHIRLPNEPQLLSLSTLWVVKISLYSWAAPLRETPRLPLTKTSAASRASSPIGRQSVVPCKSFALVFPFCYLTCLCREASLMTAAFGPANGCFCEGALLRLAKGLLVPRVWGSYVAMFIEPPSLLSLILSPCKTRLAWLLRRPGSSAADAYVRCIWIDEACVRIICRSWEVLTELYLFGLSVIICKIICRLRIFLFLL